jgi:type II secretory pathway pseudopilin PulG
MMKNFYKNILIKKKFKNIQNCSGNSILEIIVAMAIFSLIMAAISELILGSFASQTRGSELLQAQALAQEGVEGINAIADHAWNEIGYSDISILLENGTWKLGTEGSSEQIGNYSRIIRLDPVYRFGTGELATEADPQAYLDINSRLLNVEIKWLIREGQYTGISRSAYLSNWRDKTWRQNNWIAGGGQAVYSETDKYDTDDGNIYLATSSIALREIATSTFATNGQLISSAFDSGAPSVFNSIEFRSSLPTECPECQIKIQIQTAPDQSDAPGMWSATWSGPNGEDGNENDFFTNQTGELVSKSHNGQQWIRYKAVLIGNGAYSPSLLEVRINYKNL